MLQKFDERNRDLIVNVSGELVHRDQARISPFDSSVQGGDAVWEGLRLYSGRIFRLEQHLDRLVNSAKALVEPRTASISPAAIAAISAQALTRHQNQRSRSTSPGPVPIRMMNRNTPPTLSMKNDTTPAITASRTDAQRAARMSVASSRWVEKRA